MHTMTKQPLFSLGSLALLSCLSLSVTAWSSTSTRHRRVLVSSSGRTQSYPATTSTRRGRSELRMSLIGEVSSLYSYALTDYKLVTESATSGLLCGTADVLAQTRERFFGGRRDEVEDSSASAMHESSPTSDEAVDLGRCARFACKGLVGGILWSNYYGIADGWSTELSLDSLGSLRLWLDAMGLDSTWTTIDVVRNAGRIVMAILLEQFVACPIIYTFWDIPVPALLNGMPARDIPANVRSKIGPLLVDNAKVWSFVNIGVYSLPVEFRVLAMSVADVFWQSVVASVANKDVDPESSESNSGGGTHGQSSSGFSLNPRIIQKKDVDDLSSKLRH